ncbi:hypothetical protein TNCV_2844671 [Trichonephila clavipes]|nr:hypothetical protein TNCV_2844671 [Trichonephila clavipes]
MHVPQSTKRLSSKQSADGGGEERRKESGRPKAVNQGGDKTLKNPESRTQCRAAKSCFLRWGHGESGVLRSAEWHDGALVGRWDREAWLLCFVWMEDFQKFLPWLRAM